MSNTFQTGQPLPKTVIFSTPNQQYNSNSRRGLVNQGVICFRYQWNYSHWYRGIFYTRL